MKELLYEIVGVIAELHTYIMNMNDNNGGNFTDKELHFLVIGIIGIAMVLVLYPLFKYLAETGHTMVIVFLYVITVLVVIAFAIEIGQGVTGTGVMEFDDIVYGIGGFLAMFLCFMIVRGIYHLILRLFR